MLKNTLDHSLIKHLLLIVILVVSIELMSMIFTIVAPSLLDQKILKIDEILELQTTAIERSMNSSTEALAQFDGELGWVVRSKLDGNPDVSNSLGMRGQREYTANTPARITRVMAFGDSFVFGSEVANTESWPYQIELMYPDMEVLNFGVPSFDVGQAFLQFRRQAERFESDVVILGINPWMLERGVQMLAGGYQPREEFTTRPRWVIEQNGMLKMIPNPISSLAELSVLHAAPRRVLEFSQLDWSYNPLVFENPFYDWSATVRVFSVLGGKIYKDYLDSDRPLSGPPGRRVFNESSEAFRVCLKLVVRFVQEARALEMEPLVVLMPDRYSIERVFQGHPRIMGPLVEALKAHGIPYTDVMKSFQEAAHGIEKQDWYAPFHHYSRSGNEIVAKHVAMAIRGPARAAR